MIEWLVCVSLHLVTGWQEQASGEVVGMLGVSCVAGGFGLSKIEECLLSSGWSVPNRKEKARVSF